MPRVKIQLADNIKRVVVVDTDATVGATLGTNVYLNGAVGTPEAIRTWLGVGAAGDANIRNGYGILISGANPKTVNVNAAAPFAWTGQHQWSQSLWGPNGTAAAPAVTFTSDPDTGLYRVGANNLGISTGGALRWDVDSSRTSQSVRWVVDAGATDGSSVYKLPDYTAGSTAEAQRPLMVDYSSGPLSGTAAATTRYALQIASRTDAVGGITAVLSNTGTNSNAVTSRLGFWTNLKSGTDLSPPTDYLVPPGIAGADTLTIGHMLVEAPSVGFSIYRFNSTATGVEVMRAPIAASQMLFPQGSSAAPGISFIGDENTGFSTNGTSDAIRAICGGGQVAGFFTNTVQYNVQLQSNFGGTAGAPDLSKTGDTNTGIWFQAADTMDVVTGGSTRYRFGASGQLGIGGATYGTAGQALLSGGASAAPTWTTLGANPSATFGVNLTGANGTATTYLRSDAVLKLDPAINVTWTGTHQHNGNVGFNSTAPIAKPTVSGSRADPEAALANLLTALANYGLVTNSTTV